MFLTDSFRPTKLSGREVIFARVESNAAERKRSNEIVLKPEGMAELYFPIFGNLRRDSACRPR